MEKSIWKTTNSSGSKLNLLKACLIYMDKNGILDQVKQTCERRAPFQNQLVITFIVDINPLNVIDQNPLLGNLILNFHQKGTMLFQEVVFHTIKALNLFPWDISMSQVSVLLRLLTVPSISGVYVVQSFHELLKIPDNSRIVCLEGVVCGLTALSKYTQFTKYVCNQEECVGHTSNDYIRMHIPGASETQTIRNDLLCFHCGSILSENKSCRTLADKIIADMIPKEAVCPVVGKRFQAVTIYIRGDLIKTVCLGKKCSVIGVIRKDFVGKKVLITIEANNIEEIPRIQRFNNSSFLPRSIQKLYNNKSCISPWNFALSLAYLFGERITPPGTFWKLKLSMLLSLVSQTALHESGTMPLHVCAIGKESLAINRLFQHGLKFAERSASYAAEGYLSGRVTNDPYETSSFYIEGGSLLLATGGICYLGDMNRIKKTVKENLQTVLNCGKIQLEVGSKFTGGLPQVLEYPLSCHLWAYVDSSNHKKVPSEDIFMQSETGDIPKALLDAFGVVQFTDHTDYETAESIHMLMIDHTLRTATENEYWKMDNDDWHFLSFLQERHVAITNRAELLLQNYYMACRRVRTSGLDTSVVPLSALQILISLATSFAKLSLHFEVTEEDAIMAIKLYEESLTSRFGYSAFAVQPFPHIPVGRKELFLGEENDKMMLQFQSNLQKFFTSVLHTEE